MVINLCQGNIYDVKNLVLGMDYMFRVRIENVYGKSKSSVLSEVIRIFSENRWMIVREDKEVDDRGVRLIRRYSYYIKVENSVFNFLQKIDKEEEMSEVGIIFFKRNSSIWYFFFVQCVCWIFFLFFSILLGFCWESVCSFKDREFRKFIEEFLVFIDDIDEVLFLKFKRFLFVFIEDDFCKCLFFVVLMILILEELNDFKGEKDSDFFIVKIFFFIWRYNFQFYDIFFVFYLDDIKFVWVMDQKFLLFNY